MSSPEFRLILDCANNSYQFGDDVTGTVEVRVDSKCCPQDLVVEQEWRTNGLGARDSKLEAKLSLFEENWLPDQVYRYPFRFVAPYGPATYHGQLLKVDWYVQARARISGAADSKVEQEIFLSPPRPHRAASCRACGNADVNPTEEAVQRPNPAPPEDDTSNDTPRAQEISDHIDSVSNTFSLGSLLLVICFVLLVAGGSQGSVWTFPKRLNLSDLPIFVSGVAFFFLFAWRMFPIVLASHLDENLVLETLRGGGLRFGPVKSLVGGYLLALSLVLGLVLLWFSQATLLALGSLILLMVYVFVRAFRQIKLGLVAIWIRPSTAERGSCITCEIRIPRPSSGLLPRATASLSAWEVAESGLLSGMVTHRHIVYEKSFPLLAADSVGDEDRLTLKALLSVPNGAPISFSSRHNRLAWKVNILVDLDGSPDLTLSYPVTVSAPVDAKDKATRVPRANGSGLPLVKRPGTYLRV